MLKVTQVKKNFNGNQVLKGIDLNIEKGDVIAIIGPSGSGKTTLLRCINFLEKADSGILEFDGQTFDLAKITKKEILQLRKKTAFVFQNFNLFRNKTVLKNVTEGLITVRKMKKAEAEKVALEFLTKVGMEDKLNSYPYEISGGQQQRVAIARALATNPQIIYFDEPTSALDPELIGEVLSVIKQLADEGRTMLIVTHELNFARSVSNKVVFMENGEIIESSSTSDFFQNPQTQRSRDFLKSLNSGH
jgi:cystine transport system ATP-binding protein/L-cystine transport system ATP-binding protein